MASKITDQLAKLAWNQDNQMVEIKYHIYIAYNRQNNIWAERWPVYKLQ